MTQLEQQRAALKTRQEELHSKSAKKTPQTDAAVAQPAATADVEVQNPQAPRDEAPKVPSGLLLLG